MKGCVMEVVDGMNYTLQEIDDALREQIPQMKRNIHRELVTQAIDQLLDQRNEIIALASCFAVEQEIA